MGAPSNAFGQAKERMSASAQLIVLLLHLLVHLGLCLCSPLPSQRHGSHWHCSTSPLFVFGASMMDVGENAQALPLRSRTAFPPYGLDYFSRPSNRYSNGRLIVDFINQGLGNGLGEDPYLVSVNPNFTCGVNFASSGAKARNSTISGDGSSSTGLFSLSVQVDQYKQFKEDILSRSRSEDTNLPSLQDFLDGIYLIEIGHNDYTSFVDIYPSYNVEGNVSFTIAAMEIALKRLHASGAMNIVVMNLIPFGCTPIMLGIRNPPIEEQDEYGCFAAFNDLADLHNSRLEEVLQKLSDELPSANWSLFDINTIFKDAIQHPESYGIKYNRRACCGAGGGEYNFNENVLCGKSGYIDGVFSRAWRCDDPSLYIFWDTLHPVESFAQIVADGFLSGDYVTSFSALPGRRSHYSMI
eukprot:c15898_g1_i1 orf=28-1260(-)